MSNTEVLNLIKNKSFKYEELTIYLHPEVYEPAEDTFQLLEVLNVKKGDTVFEIGAGCGIIALECCKNGANVLCSDINPFAVELTRRNYDENKALMKGKFETRKGDLFQVLTLSERFDIIIFNPPYLPTKPKDLVGGSGWFDKAVDGGDDGLKIIEFFINGLQKHLAQNGQGYFVFSSLSDRKKLETYISKKGFKKEIKSTIRYDDEVLDVYCIGFKK